MTAPWNGLPDQPERSGWHWLKPHQDNYAVPFEWNPDEGYWEVDIDEDGSPAEMADSGYQYICPCPDPSELAQIRKDERERCLTIAVDEQWNFPSNPSIQTPEATVAYNACQRIIDKIRNVGDAL